MTGDVRTAYRDMRLAATPETLWPYVSDTARLNATLGHPARRQLGVSADGLARRILILEGTRQRTATEKPGEWVHGQWWRLSQRLETGPLSDARVTLFLQREGHDTRARYTLEVTPRGRIGRLLLDDAYLAEALDRMEAILRAVVAHLSGARVRAFDLAEGPALPEARRLDLAARLAESAHGGPRGVEFIDFLSRAHDIDVAAFRPTWLAHRLKISAGQATGLCLAGVRAGLVEQTLTVTCPVCHAVTTSAQTLQALPLTLVCRSCGLGAPLDLSAHVDVTFAPAPALRKVADSGYCLSGPQRAPQTLIQQIMEPAERRAFLLPLGTGRYRARIGHSMVSEAITTEAGAIVRITPDAVIMEPGAGQGEIVFENHCTTPVLAALGRLGPPQEWTTAATLLTLQCQRDLFPEAGLHGDTPMQAGDASVLHLRTTDDNSELLPDPLRALATALDGALVHCDGETATMLFAHSTDALKAGMKLTGADTPDQPGEAIAVGIDTGALSFVPGPGLYPAGAAVERAVALCAMARSGVMLVTAMTLHNPEAARAARRVNNTQARTTILEGDPAETVWCLGGHQTA